MLNCFLDSRVKPENDYKKSLRMTIKNSKTTKNSYKFYFLAATASTSDGKVTSKSLFLSFISTNVV